jgi:hypothetical protein
MGDFLGLTPKTVGLGHVQVNLGKDDGKPE